MTIQIDLDFFRLLPDGYPLGRSPALSARTGAVQLELYKYPDSFLQLGKMVYQNPAHSYKWIGRNTYPRHGG